MCEDEGDDDDGVCDRAVGRGGRRAELRRVAPGLRRETQSGHRAARAHQR